MMLKDRVAIVSGGGRNIGRAIAYRLHEMGCTVVVCARTQKEIDHTAGVIQEQGGRSVALQCDVGKEADIRRVVEGTRKLFGRIDFLINNAGNYVYKSIEDTSMDEFDVSVDANLRGTFLFCKHVIPEMRRFGRGRIINVASLFGLIPSANVAVYCMMKAGLIGFTRALARELHSDMINVNAVCPGAVTTGDRAIELEETRPELGKHLLPRDVADVVAYLLTEGSSQITGAAIEIPGSTSFEVAHISPLPGEMDV